MTQKNKLTDEQLKFCEEYLKCMSVSEAVEKVFPYGTSKSKVLELISDPNLKVYLDVRRQEIRNIYITKEDILLRTLDLYDKCVQPVPVLDKRGHPTGEYQMDTRGATKILELMYKHLGLVDADTKQDIPNVVPQVVLSEKELETFRTHFESEF